jgi:hypothetical protein
MPVNPTETTAAGRRARQVRRRPLVSPEVVRRWAAQAGVVVPDGDIDEATVELYLYWSSRRRPAGEDADVRRAGPAWRAHGAAAPPVSPALLQAASCASDPVPCPACGGAGSLTYVDLARRIQRHWCGACERQWSSLLTPDGADGGGPALT